MLNLNSTTLAAVAEKAAQDAAQHPRWLTAIGRALIELDTNPWIERNEEGHGILIASPSGAVYSANGVCQCEAYAHGRACWHRAAARLVRLHDEREAATELIDRPGTPTGPMEDYGMPAKLPPSRPLGERLAAARKVAAEFNAELFA